jgi:hypothetical protein
MTSWNQLIAELAQAVHNEVQLAPDLLADMAKLEGYVAESYHQRTFIELIQNADDAMSQRAYCIIRPGFVIFANDGRGFAEADLRSICRSGASLKAAEQNKIGYRGIGFKSTINLGESIHVFSDSLTFSFSKTLTEQSLGSHLVPTLRMPHPLSLGPVIQGAAQKEISRLREAGFGTLFVFETKDSAKATAEFSLLKGEDLLFLSNVNELSLDAAGQQIAIVLERRAAEIGTHISVRSGSALSNWLVISRGTDPATAVAFPTDIEGLIEGTRFSPQPVHCFLPTLEASGFGFRVNGRFSTDPSRTRIEFDESTRLAMEDVTEIIVGLLSSLAQMDTVPRQFVSVFTALSSPVGFSRFGEKLRNSLMARARTLAWMPGFDGSKRPATRPEWLSPAEFAAVVGENDVASKTLARLEAHCPSFAGFLQECGLTPLKSKDIIVGADRLTELGRAETIVQVIKELRSGATAVLAAGFEDAALWTQKDGDLAPLRRGNHVLSDKTRSYLTAALSSAEMNWANEKWQLDLVDASEAFGPKANKKIEDPAPNKFLGRPDTRNLKRWRTVEQNMVELLSAQLGAKVSDVSQSNLGYDLEVQHDDGRREYVEVKSVERGAGEFVLTNNEYAQASLVGTSYILALCRLEESKISWVLVRDPVRALSLARRCSRWEWASTSLPTFEHTHLLR